MPESAFTELAAYRAIAPTPAEVTRKIADLERDNQKERDKVRDLTEKAKGVPPEGSVVLTAEEAKVHEAWKALGVKPEDVATLKTERDTLATEKKQRDRKDILRSALATEGWNEQAPDVLQNTTGFDALELSEGEVTVERLNGGKKENVKQKTAFATVEGKQVRVADIIKEKWPYLAPVLVASASGNGSTAGGDGRGVPEQRGMASAGGTTRTPEDHAKAVRTKVDYSV
jgi:hypothetical protein